MNSSKSFPAVIALFPLLAASGFAAVIVTETASFTPGLLIPDNSIVGVADTRVLTSQIVDITNVRVSLNIAGAPNAGSAFNGDFYAYLTHSTGFSILLNRPGVTAGDPFGYGDSGFNVTLDDVQPVGDIHNYQLTSNPAGGVLTGTWRADGRNVNPSVVLDTTPRTAGLNIFNGLNANGSWTLFVADTSAVGTGRLVSWGLEVTGNTPIPEPGTALFGVCIAAATLGRRRSR